MAEEVENVDNVIPINRAERRRQERDALKAEGKLAAVPRVTAIEVLIPSEVMPNLRARHAMVRHQFPDFGTFIWFLALEGVEVFDRDVEAQRLHAEGQSKPVDQSTEAKPERLVLAPDEVPAEATRVLAKLHDATVKDARR